MIVRRTIKNSVQEYEYKGKEKKYDTNLQIRISTEEKEKLNEIAIKLGYNSTSKMLREMINNVLVENSK